MVFKIPTPIDAPLALNITPRILKMPVRKKPKPNTFLTVDSFSISSI